MEGGTILEELLVFALLLCEGMAAEDEYDKKLDELFLKDPENEDLLYLEWETDIKKAILHIRAHTDYRTLDYERFGRILMGKLKRSYRNCTDIRSFANRMYSLWKSLPEDMRHKEPFFTLCYADDPLSWGDEKQTRSLYEDRMDYYKDEGCTND